jgi:DNA-binding response OmpR family regulator
VRARQTSGALAFLSLDNGALQEFRSHRDHIDLALLDVVLPKLSGPEGYARIC